MRAPMKCYFFRQGVQLKDHAYNGADLLGLGEPSGITGKLFCIESIDVARGPHDATTLTPAAFDGPVMVKIWSPGQTPQWFGLASIRDVARVRSTGRPAAKHSGRAAAVSR